MMKTYLLVGSIVLLLTACTPAGVTTDTNVKLGGELSDCTYHTVSKGTGSDIHVIRCPNSDVTTQWVAGKANRVAVTLEENNNAK